MGPVIFLSAARQHREAAIAAWYGRCAEILAVHGVWPEHLEDFQSQLERYRLAGLGPREAAERLLGNLGFFSSDDWS